MVPTISGTAWITGMSQYGVDPADPFPNGFKVKEIWRTAENMKPTLLPAALFTLNRERLVKKVLPRSLAVLNANDIMPTNADGTMGYLQNADLFYLTGVHQEETILLLAPDAFDPNHREVLFVREPTDHLTIWEGHKLAKQQATEISGIQNVKWLSEFPSVFRTLMCEMENVYLNTNEHHRADHRRITRHPIHSGLSDELPATPIRTSREADARTARREVAARI